MTCWTCRIALNGSRERSCTYQLTSDDGRGPQNESLTGTGTAPGRVTVPAPGDGGWKLKGSAQLSGADLQLTRTGARQVGSAVFPVPVVTDGLKAAFSTVIGGGSGGDGRTFGLLDPGRRHPHRAGQRDAVITATSYAVPPPGPNRWTCNGFAALSGTYLVLTQAVQGARGSAVQGTAVPSARLKATFTAAIGGGTGADGLALLLLDAAKATPTALGAGGGGLGYAGLPGIAVTLDTHRNTGDRSANFVGVAVGGTGSPFTYAATSTAVPALRTGTHVVDVTVTTAGHVLVAVDGTQVIDTAVALPQNVLVGFAAATGSATDNHTVRGVKITY
ncbi:hypothetical protein [Streptomyces sp. NPDC002685]|uniref:lectin-like domain-containing protein n=1 Tax=Streptomyces sp. NPDC002685 TaxID=3154540 RepID=UPI00332F434E